jgi:hypothetical protein
MQNTGTFLEGRVKRRLDIRATADKETDIITSLNLCVLSKKMPITIDPKIPETMKIAPNSELFSIV